MKQPACNSFGILLLGFLLLAACSSDGGRPCGEGHDGVPAKYNPADVSQVLRIGNLVINEEKRVGVAPSHDTLVSASFADFTGVTVQDGSTEKLSEACVIYLSKSVREGTATQLKVTKVSVAGLSEPVLLTPDVNNKINPQSLPGRALTTAAVNIKVDSDTNANDFPAFAMSLDSPEIPVLTRVGDLPSPDLSSSPSLGIRSDREKPLVLEWKPGNGHYVEIVILPGTGTSSAWAKVRCITHDDGCFEIPAQGLRSLSQDTATNFEFSFMRHLSDVVTFLVDGRAKAVANAKVSSVLRATVVR